MKTHKKSNYKELSEAAMERNPKRDLLTEEQRQEIIEENSKISSCLHAEWQMLRAAEQFHQDVYKNMVAIYRTVPLDQDPALRKLRLLLKEAELTAAKQDMVMDDIYRHYTGKLFPNANAVAVDDTECYGVLYDIITTAFGCNALGDTLESEYEIIKVRKSYLQTLYVADPMARKNIVSNIKA